ncbi:hypothetical protein ACWCPS_39545 [Streptomyces mauvecolor]
MPIAPSILASVTAVAVGALLVGCSAHVEVGKLTPKLSADKVADTVAEKLAATTGQPKPHVACRRISLARSAPPCAAPSRGAMAAPSV